MNTLYPNQFTTEETVNTPQTEGAFHDERQSPEPVDFFDPSRRIIHNVVNEVIEPVAQQPVLPANLEADQPAPEIKADFNFKDINPQSTSDWQETLRAIA